MVGIGLVAACSSDTSISVGQLPSLVLQPSDVGGSLSLFDEGSIGRAEMQAPRDDPSRFGRTGGWKARYKQPGDAEADGPLVIESLVDAFESEEGADEDLEAYRELLERARGDVGPEMVNVPAIGDEAIGMTLTQQAFPDPVRFYTIAWRQANVVASVTVQGFEGKVELDDPVDLARRVERRIERAAE